MPAPRSSRVGPPGRHVVSLLVRRGTGYTSTVSDQRQPARTATPWSTRRGAEPRRRCPQARAQLAAVDESGTKSGTRSPPRPAFVVSCLMQVFRVLPGLDSNQQPSG